MTVSIANMAQVWMSNTNTYNGIAMSISTMGYGANTNSRLFKLRVDGNTKFDIDANGRVTALDITANTISVNTIVALSTSNAITTGSLTANTVSANIANSTGSLVLVNGYPRQPGQIIEYLASPCDGSTIVGASGSYTVQNVTTQQSVPTSYVDVTGSSITYTPPAGATRIIYRFTWSGYWVNAHGINHYKFFIGGNEILYARHCRSAQYSEDKYTFEWPIAIGGSTNYNVGRLATWTTPLLMKMQVYGYGSNSKNLHGTTYWDGGGSNQFSIPHISIIAIA